MGLALLFPGQGSQHPQMLPWLDGQAEARPVLDALAARLGAGWRDNLADGAWLHTNLVAQPLLTGIGMATWQALAPHLPRPVAVAGYSVGELAAFAVAGVFDPDTALELAQVRAHAMNDCAAGAEGGLLSVRGPQALALAQASPLALAIRIHEEFVLVGGPTPALDAQAERWRAQGLHCTRLPIAIASHTPAMAEAAAVFGRHLSGARLQTANTAIVCNYTGSASRNPAVLGPALASQIASTVRWDDCLDSIAERGVRCVLEVGPGTALSAMWRERHPDVPARSADEFSSVSGLAQWVQRQLA